MPIENVVHQLENIGAPPLGFRSVPLGASPSDPLVSVTTAAVASLVSLNSAAGAVEPAATPEKRRELLANSATIAATKLAEANAAIRRETAALEAATKALELPAPTANPAEAAADQEIRAWYRGNDPAQQAKIFEEMTQGQHPSLLRALARFDMPDFASVQARKLHASFQRVQNPTKVAALELHAERLRWATSLAKAMGQALQAATVRGDVPFMH